MEQISEIILQINLILNKIIISLDKINPQIYEEIDITKLVIIENCGAIYRGTSSKLCYYKRCKQCYDKSFASHLKCKELYDKNINPRLIFRNSHNYYDFICSNCNHIYPQALDKSSTGRNCPYCRHLKSCGKVNCQFCYFNTLACHYRYKDYNFIKNYPIEPINIFLSCHNNYWFICPDCHHDILVTISHITRLDGGFCYYCSKGSDRFCEDLNCKHCYDKSFASLQNPIVNWWSVKNPITPRFISKQASKKILFDCPICNHEFKSILQSIYNGCRCPYCNSDNFCDNLDCKFCYNKSFISHSRSIFLDPSDISDANNTTKGSGRILKFICKEGHPFETTPYFISIGYWCNKCNNSTECKVYEFLVIKYPTIIYQAKFEWCKKIFKLSFDFCIEEKKCIIEVDGGQHFKDIKHWKLLCKDVQENDKFKTLCALQNGYSIIRIFQEDIYSNNMEWQDLLIQNIENIQFGEIKYIAKNSQLYDSHKKIMEI